MIGVLKLIFVGWRVQCGVNLPIGVGRGMTHEICARGLLVDTSCEILVAVERRRIGDAIVHPAQMHVDSQSSVSAVVDDSAVVCTPAGRQGDVQGVAA